MSQAQTTHQPQVDAAAETHELPLGHLLAMFWRERRTIAACTVLGAIAGIVHLQQHGTVWRAQSRVYVESKGPSLGTESLLLGIGARNYAKTQAELMLSSEVLDGALVSYLRQYPSPMLFGDSPSQAIWMKRHLDVAVGRDSDIITVSLDSRHKPEACALVNAVVASYRSFQTERQKDTAAEMRTLLDEAIERHDVEFRRALQAVTTYRKEHPGVGSAAGGLAVVQDTWRALQVDLTRAESELLAAEAAWTSARELQADPSMLRQVLPTLSTTAGGGPVQVTSPPSTVAMLTQIFDLLRDRADLLVKLQPDHPRVKVVDQAIAELRGAIAAEDLRFAQVFVASLEQRYLAKKVERDKLLEAVHTKEREVLRLDSLEAEYQSLVDVANQARNQLELDRTKLYSIPVTPESDLTSITVMDTATPETAEVASNRTMRLAIALLLGLFAGFGIAWLRGLLDQCVRTAEDARIAVGIPLLAILPRTLRPRRGETKTALERWETSSHYAEAARSLRTAVYFGTAESEGKVLQVTSPDSADGKTTIAASLAIAMAKAEQRTLLIDADMRRPQQAQQFCLDNTVGLSTLLRHGGTAGEVVQSTVLPGLDVMTSGPVPDNPAEILNSPAFGELLAELATRYDRIIVDSPPVLPVADARIIATRCSATILALRVDRSTRKRAATAREMLASVGANVLGTTLNDMPSGIGYGYGAGYGAGYGYGYGYESGHLRRDDNRNNKHIADTTATVREPEATVVVGGDSRETRRKD